MIKTFIITSTLVPNITRDSFFISDSTQKDSLLQFLVSTKCLLYTLSDIHQYSAHAIAMDDDLRRPNVC